MNSETILEVINKLVGNIEPYGETYHDEKAYNNQEELIYIIRELIGALGANSRYKNRVEYSVKKIGKRAYNSLKNLYDVIGDIINEDDLEK